ncbi:flagellar export chaperone FliS [Glaciihabitans sp. UYNi722]|uniref:flagellar export chaperone FliS n=1 Tax=Glaciihabitans sp. UYNi722 TaxID=3156344 RepID=UPI0033997FE3
MTTLSAQRSQYNNDAILSASPVRLLTMLYDRLLLDLGRAEIAHSQFDWPVMSSNLLHAQAIVSELSTSLKVELWDGGDNLLALYNYCNGLLITSNVRRDASGIRETIELFEPLRQAWHEAAGQLSVPNRSDLTGSQSTDSRELGVA